MSGWEKVRKALFGDPNAKQMRLAAQHQIGLPGLAFDEFVIAEIQPEQKQLLITQSGGKKDTFILRLSQIHKIALLDVELDVVKANSPIAHGMLWGLVGGRNSDILAAMTWRPTRTEQEMRRGLIWIEYDNARASYNDPGIVLYPIIRDVGERFAEALCFFAGIDGPTILKPEEGPTTTYL